MQSIIDFLLTLMRDPQARAQFDQNPQAAMTQAGVAGASAQDVRDAQLEMADRGFTRSAGGGSSSGSGSDDPVQEISYTTRHYHVTEDAPDTITNINNIAVDDRDVTITDSFNSDDDITIIDDSFNKSVENDVTAVQDNDTVIVQDNDTTTGAPAGPAPAAAPDPEPANVPLPETAAVLEPAPEEFAAEEPDDVETAEPAEDTDTADVDAVV